jgi:hypothetical protein
LIWRMILSEGSVDALRWMLRSCAFFRKSTGPLRAWGHAANAPVFAAIPPYFEALV